MIVFGFVCLDTRCNFLFYLPPENNEEKPPLVIFTDASFRGRVWKMCVKVQWMVHCGKCSIHRGWPPLGTKVRIFQPLQLRFHQFSFEVGLLKVPRLGNWEYPFDSAVIDKETDLKSRINTIVSSLQSSWVTLRGFSVDACFPPSRLQKLSHQGGAPLPDQGWRDLGHLQHWPLPTLGVLRGRRGGGRGGESGDLLKNTKLETDTLATCHLAH